VVMVLLVSLDRISASEAGGIRSGAGAELWS
jgi:hypothetical protein